MEREASDVREAVRWRLTRAMGGYDRSPMRTAVLQCGLTAAALAVIVGSCMWAWASADFWQAVPLYPAVAVAGVLSGSASHAWHHRPGRATLEGVGATLVTLLGTALISLARWGW
jgi:Na+/glutamate symporter